MRIFIFLFTFSSTALAQDVNWKQLDNELEFLKNNAFVSKKVVERKTETTTEKNTLSLRRKPIKTATNNDPEVVPLEKQYFDQVNFKYSGPQREDAPSKEKIRESLEKEKTEIRINGALPKID